LASCVAAYRFSDYSNCVLRLDETEGQRQLRRQGISERDGNYAPLRTTPTFGHKWRYSRPISALAGAGAAGSCVTTAGADVEGAGAATAGTAVCAARVSASAAARAR